MTPYLTTSARPHRNSRAGSVRQGRRVDPDADRLVERADDVLGAGVVDADLAADRAVPTCASSVVGTMTSGSAAGVGRGDEAGQVADDAAAQGDDRRVAIGPQSDEVVIKVGGPIERLTRLARGHDGARRRDPDGSNAAAQGAARAATFASVTSKARRQLRPDQVASRAARANAPNPSLPLPTHTSYDRGPSSTRTRMAGSVELSAGVVQLEAVAGGRLIALSSKPKLFQAQGPGESTEVAATARPKWQAEACPTGGNR